jgi:RNA polymerase sigma-70 factor (ECF subfamily)
MKREDADTFVEDLYESWYATLVRYAFRSCGNLANAEEATQESFLLLYRELIKGTHIESAKGWTLTVLRRSLRRTMRRPDLSFLRVDDPHVLDSCPAPLPHEEEPILRLHECLTRREEEVLLLRLEGCKYRDIAQSLGVSTSAVGTLIARAVVKLQSKAGQPAREWEPRR